MCPFNILNITKQGVQTPFPTHIALTDEKYMVYPTLNLENPLTYKL